MKLLDLQTGKYLELGKDWLCGGKCVHLFTEEIEGFKEQEPINDAIHNGFYADCMYLKACDQDQPQEPLKTLCEQTGAVVYGDRYVLFENKECGNIYCEKNKWGTVYYLNKDIYSFIPCPEFNPENDKKATVQMFFSLNKCEDNLISNLFEEYSKSLRGEENGLNKLMELIK